jgi:hypothetical protein
MKKIFTFILVLIALSASASFDFDLPKVSDPGMAEVQTAYQQILEKVNGLGNGSYYGYQFAVQVKLEEAAIWEEIIASAMEEKLTGYSAPEDLVVEGVPNPALEDAITQALANLPSPQKEKDAQLLWELIQDAHLGNPQMLIFTGQEGNSFGGGGFLALVDPEHNQILILGSSYAE